MKHNHSRAFLAGFILALIAAMIALAAYIAWYYAETARQEAASARYAAMYATTAPTAVPTAAETPSPTPEPLPRVSDEAIPTPEAGTLVFALPTAPAPRERFAELLSVNPETVGFLTMGDDAALPVVQRLNDNEYYLDHDFEGGEAREGTLFLDGSNRLFPEDGCLIVYGHNMKNGTMFGHLHRYAELAYLKSHAAVRFDTLYDDRVYVPFAAFSASMDRSDAGYFEVRRFLLEGDAFDDFVGQLRARSRFDVPLDVAQGDGLLLLVTCDYSQRDGRFILALRRLREEETEADALGDAQRARIR